MRINNQVTLIGNLGGNPEVREGKSGKNFLGISLATNEYYKDARGESQTKTDWHKLVFFGNSAEVIAEKCKSGSKLMVEGKLQTRKWENGDETRYFTEVVVSDFMIINA